MSTEVSKSPEQKEGCDEPIKQYPQIFGSGRDVTLLSLLYTLQTSRWVILGQMIRVARNVVCLVGSDLNNKLRACLSWPQARETAHLEF